MEDALSPGLLDEGDGLNPTRALILQGDYALRRTRLPIHIWDRGGSGRPTLRWALARRIPYLTVMQGSTSWARYRRSPRAYTRTRVPVFVQRDVAVARGNPPGSSPEVVVYPAHPERGRRVTKALRYRRGTPLSKLELSVVARVYRAPRRH